MFTSIVSLDFVSLVADIIPIKGGQCSFYFELPINRGFTHKKGVSIRHYHYFGYVKCAHGILPVPAPATVILLEGIPSYGGEVKGELCTPTGAALVKFFANEFGFQPLMNVKKIRYGMGKKDFSRLSCVRAMLGIDG